LTPVDLFGEDAPKIRNRMQAATSGRVRESDVWLTPPEVLEALGPFDLDPCAAPEPRPWPTAARMLTLPTNGLVAPWSGRVWLNPPYGPEAGRWLRRAAEHGDAIAIVPARTETAWAHETVWGAASGVFFFYGRLHFHRRDGVRARHNAGAPHMLVAYGERNVDAIEASGLCGVLVGSWDVIR
jgi:hypothetical protein